MKKFSIVLFLFFLTFLQTKVYLHSGFPYTHDGENHLARFMNYKVAVREGQIPPRFAPNLLNHYGYPVFNFNYPLANILSLPFSFTKTNPEFSFKIIVTVSVFLGCIYCSRWLKQYFKSIRAVLVGTAVFLLSPFLASAIYFRGNIGEILGYLFLPFLFYTIDRIKMTKKVNWGHILGYTLFALSHNLTVVLSLPLLLGYSFIVLRNKRKLWKILIFQLLTASLFSAWFWLPAILEKGQTVVDQVNLVKEFPQHFVTLNQLFFAPLNFGYSLDGPIDSLGFSMGIIAVATLFFSVLVFIKIFINGEIKKNSSNILFIFSLLVSFFLLFLQLQLSKIVWDFFPFLHIIQFPWRLTLFVMPMLTFMSAFLIEKFGKYVFIILLIATLVQIQSLLDIRPVDWFHKNTIDYELFSQTTSTQNENRARTFTYQGFFDWKPGPMIIPDSGKIDVIKWNGSARRYSLHLTEETKIIEPTMYFSGWETWVREKGETEKRIKAEYTLDPVTQGRIAFTLPAGNYDVQTSFTQHTTPRMIGNGLFVFGILFSLFIYLRGKKVRQ